MKSGYVTEKSDGVVVARALADETGNRRAAQANLQWAARFAPRLRPATFKMIAASGSTSYYSASKSRDLDFFCITSEGRLWTALTQGLIHARVFSLAHPRSPEICFSCIMDEAFAANLFREEQGPLFARDALATIVLRGESTYRWLLSEAEWISRIYPNAYAKRLKQGPAIKGRGGPSAVSRVVELFLFLVVGTYVRTKSKMLNQRLERTGQLDRLFAIRCGRNHLIYESRRYSRLKQRYSRSFTARARLLGPSSASRPNQGGGRH